MTILRPRQKTFVERSIAALKEHGNSLGVAPTGCHAPGTPILLYNGSIKTVEDINIGDQLMGPDSQPRHVLALYRGVDNLYKINPVKGDSFIVNAGHILSLVNDKEVVNISVEKYLNKSPLFKRKYKLYRSSIDFPIQPEPDVEPYVMGLLIGDGCLMSGLSKITDEFKLASRIERQELLAGLIDNDGEVIGSSIRLHNSSDTLINDIAFVARSLGFFANVSTFEVSGRKEYKVTIRGDFKNIPIRNDEKKPSSSIYKKNPLKTSFTVDHVGCGEYYGFSVNKDHLYLMGDFTVTHNSGKTIMLSAVTGDMLKDSERKACVLAHRDELTSQNDIKFRRVNPNITTSIFDAKQKDWSGQTTFSMVQTLSRESGLKQIPSLDLLVIDEAHHAAADSYRRVIDTVKERNPEALIYGVTATPNRADRKGLRPVFSNVSDQITISELIKSGHLVPPRTYDIDLGQREALSKLTGSANAVDMAAGMLLNTRPTNQSVIKHWKEKAGERQTIVFCSTVEHAKDVTQSFIDHGISAECIHGDLSTSERKTALSRYESNQSQVIVNVSVLTEGYDYPPTSCVVILRLNSCKSTFLQMIGRGLRTVDPEVFPGMTKTDCIVLDFGTSTSSFGRLEEDVDLDGGMGKGEAPTKLCPDCDAILPASSQSCSLCGYVFERSTEKLPEVLTDFVMTEVDMLNKSSFKWCDLFGDECALLATGFEAWAGLFFLNNQWYAVGGLKKTPPKLLSIGDRLICLAAADDFLNTYETEKAAVKSKRWLSQAATRQQLQYLGSRYRNDFNLTRYHASCLLAFKFNKRAIQSMVFKAENTQQKAA